jgi:hypothetical protein
MYMKSKSKKRKDITFISRPASTYNEKYESAVNPQNIINKRRKEKNTYLHHIKTITFMPKPKPPKNPTLSQNPNTHLPNQTHQNPEPHIPKNLKIEYHNLIKRKLHFAINTPLLLFKHNSTTSWPPNIN